MSVERRLAAILAADVVGYSRLIGADEAGTLTALRALLKELVEPTIKQHRGRIVKLMGDGLLAEFASVVDAVAAAVEIQEATPERSADLAEDRRVALRVGVNIGDIAVEAGDIFGDGVNVAARLQEIAAPNGVAISDDAYRQLSGRLDVPFLEVGEKELKNIKQRVRVWLWSPTSGTDASPLLQEPMALSDKPSVAVLPFDNMSGDPDQEYFSDGVTEDIITALSRIRWFRVVARNSTFSYKGLSPDIRKVAEDLGVRYVIEGSVRRAGARIRLTAQLIDGESGDHLWAQRYDRELEDIFDLQDELTQTIVGAIEPELGRAERERAKRGRSSNLQAWDTCQRAMWHYHKRGKQDYADADRLFRKAIAEDAELVQAYSGLAQNLSMSAILGYAEQPRSQFEEAVALARRAVEIDPQDADARVALCRAYNLSRQPEKGCVEGEAAIGIDPNYGVARYNLAASLIALGRSEEGIAELETAIRLSPNDPMLGQFYARMAQAHLFSKRYREAANWADQALRQPGALWPMAMFKASALGHLGNSDKATDAVDEVFRLFPEFDQQKAREIFPYPEHLDHIFDGLRKAGWSG